MAFYYYYPSKKVTEKKQIVFVVMNQKSVNFGMFKIITHFRG